MAKRRSEFGRDIATPLGRLKAHLHYEFVDHGLLRRPWTNLAEVAPGVWRSNHPHPARLARYKAMGIRTILSLRGTARLSPMLFEAEACAKLGLRLVTAELHARKPAPREAILRLLDLFPTLERPFLMHCKSGADRAGLAAALYLLQAGQPLDVARRQLHWSFLHLRSTSTGVLDHILDLYGERLKDGPLPIRDWIATEYDAARVAESWARLRR